MAGTGEDDDPALEAIVVSSGPVPELKVSQALDQSRGAESLDRIGPAVVMAHSLGGPAGWLIADARPDLVKALVEIEAVGPPFAENPQWAPRSNTVYGGAADLRPAVDDPAELEGKPRRLPNLAKVPIAYVGSASPFVHFHDAMVGFLREAGCDVTSMELDEQGVEGNGHAMMLEEQRGGVGADRPLDRGHGRGMSEGRRPAGSRSSPAARAASAGRRRDGCRRRARASPSSTSTASARPRSPRRCRVTRSRSWPTIGAEEDVERYVAAAVERFGRIDLHHLYAGIPGMLAPLPDVASEDFSNT